MANYAEMLEHNASMRRKPKNALHSINLKKADNGGVVAEHRMSNFEGNEPVHAFGKDEGHLLAAHIEKHLGISMPHAQNKESEEAGGSEEPEAE